MMHRFLVLLICLSAGLAYAESNKIYTWTDEDGTVHYGDRPPANADAEEVGIRGKKPEPVQVVPSTLTGTWFGRQDEGGEVRVRFQENGNIRYTQTFPDQTIFTYQGIWSLEGRTMNVITEFIEEGGGNNLRRSVEPVRLTYTFTEFGSEQLTMINAGNSYTLNKVQ